MRTVYGRSQNKIRILRLNSNLRFTILPTMNLLILLELLLFVSHCVYAQSVEHEHGSSRVRSAMSGKFKLDDTNAATGEALSQCESNLETAIQNVTLLQEEIERMVGEFNAELDSLEHNLKRKIKQVQSAKARAGEIIKKQIELDGELRYMHQQAVSTYVNFTLMQEDVVHSVQKAFFGSWRFMENRWRRMNPRIRRAKQAYHAELRRLRPRILSLERKITNLSNKVEKLWTKSTILRPFAQAVSTKLYQQFEPSIKVAKEVAFLTTVSTIEEVSSAGISFLDALAEKQKKKARRDQERQIERRRRATSNRHQRPIDDIRRDKDRRKLRNKADDDDIDFTPSFLQRKAKGALEHALRHPKRLADRVSALFPLVLSLLATRTFLLGSVLLFLGIPTSLIWLICLVNFLRLIKRFSPLR